MDDIQNEGYVRTCSDVEPSHLTSFGSGVTDAQLALLDQLRQYERQIVASSMTAIIAHFVGTPLNVIVGRAGLIRKHPDATEPIINDALCIQQKVDQVTERLRALIELLAPRLPSVECNAAALLSEAVQLYQPVALANSVELRFVQLGSANLQVSRFPAFVVVTSLLSLALNEVAPGTTVNVCLSEVSDPVREAANMRIVVDVPGRTFEDPRRFARFEASPRNETANSQQVLGICSAIARSIGGQLEVHISSCSGAELDLQWPGRPARAG